MKKTMRSLFLIILAILLATTFAACGDEQASDAAADASLRINTVTILPEAYVNEPYDLRDVILMEEGVTYSATAFYIETVRDTQTNVYTTNRHVLEVKDLIFTPTALADTVVTLTANKGSSTYSKVVTIATTVHKEPLDELYASSGILGGADSGITKTVNIDKLYIQGENSQSSLHVEFNSIDPHASGNTFLERSAPAAQQHFTDQDWTNAIVTFWVYNPMDKDIEFQLAIVDNTHAMMTDWSPADGVHRQFAKAGEWTQIFFSLRAMGTKHKLIHNEYSNEFLFVKMQYADYSLTNSYTFDFYLDNLDVVPASTYPEIDTTYTFTDESIDQGWENMSTDIGWQGANTVYNYEEVQGEGSVCSLKATFPGEKGKTNSFICLNPGAHSEFLELDMTGGKFSGYFKFENMPAKVSLDLINANWEASNAVELNLKDLGNGWYYGEVDMTTVHIGAGRSDKIIRIRLMFQDVTDDSVVYVDTIKYEYAYVDMVLEDMKYDWINMGMDSGMNVFKSYEYTADYKKASGSVRSIKIVADANQKASVVWHPELAVLNGQLSALPNMTKGVIRAYFYFGNQTPSATFQVINPLWHPSKEVNFIFESAGDGWYLGSVPAGLLQGFHEGNASEVIRMMINIPAGYTVYIDGLMHYPNEIYTTSINADDVFSSGIYTTSGLTGSSGANKSADGIYLWAEQAVGYPHVGVSFSTPVDISAYEDISFDIKAVSAWCWTEVKLFYLVNGAETYTSISADFGSDEWHTIVKKLTAFKGADLTQVTGIQFCVNCDDGFVKGQRNEFWFANLKLTDGSNSPADLGEAFGVDRDYQISLDNTDKLDALSFDYQITNDGVLTFAILNSDWSKYFGYYELNKDGAVGDYAGIACEKLDDGYIRVTMTLSQLQKTNNADNRDNVPEILDFIYITNRFNTAEGYIRNITLTVAEGGEPSEPSEPGEPEVTEPEVTEPDVTEPEVTEPEVTEPESPLYAIGANVAIDVAPGAYSHISFEYQITNDGTLLIAALNPDWSKYYGYYQFNASGKAETDPGVYCETLSDGYVRVTMVTAELERTNNAYNTANAPETIGLLYTGNSSAAGTIRNVVCYNEESGEPEEDTEMVVFPGADFFAGVNMNVDINAGAFDRMTFDYKIDSGTQFCLALLDSSWSKYYGYYTFTASGEVDGSQGIVCETLDDGSVRVTITLAELEKTNNSINLNNVPNPPSVFYIRGDWSDANGNIGDITCITLKSDEEDLGVALEGGAFSAGANMQVALTGSVKVLTFDYVINNGGQFCIALLDPSWSKYYGYYTFTVDGEVDNSQGVACQVLDNGYVRVTMTMADLQKTNNSYNLSNIPNPVSIFYIRGDWSTANGDIVNIYLK